MSDRFVLEAIKTANALVPAIWQASMTCYASDTP